MRLHWPVEFVNFVLLGFGFYMLHAVIQIYASELAPTARGSAMALHSFFFFFGQAIGPIVYGAGLCHRRHFERRCCGSAPRCWSRSA